MEFKVVRKGETLETASQRALEQISQKKYTQELFDHSIKKIIALWRMEFLLRERAFMWFLQ